MFDNQALLKAVKRWVCKGRKATLVGVPDADILREAIEKLRKSTTAGAWVQSNASNLMLNTEKCVMAHSRGSGKI